MKAKTSSLRSRILPTATPTTRRSGMSDANPPKNIPQPAAPINQTAPDFGRRRRNLNAHLQSIAASKQKSK